MPTGTVALLVAIGQVADMHTENIISVFRTKPYVEAQLSFMEEIAIAITIQAFV